MPATPIGGDAKPAQGVFLLGMHRSGTSMTAGVLQALGLYFGEPEGLLPANEYNQEGYFEHARATALNEGLLQANGLNWRLAPSIEGKRRLNGLDAFSKGAGEVVDALGARGLWALKDPRLCFLIRHWRPLAPDACAVICVRHPRAVAASLHRRNDISPVYAAALWEAYTLAALRSTMHMRRTICVYEEFLADPIAVAGRLASAIADWTGLERPSEDQLRRATARVRPDLGHAAEEEEDDSFLTDAQRQLYALALGQKLNDVPTRMSPVAAELIRLETAHQTAKARIEGLQTNLQSATRQAGEERERRLALLTRLCDLLGLVGSAEEATLTDEIVGQVRTLLFAASSHRVNEDARLSSLKRRLQYSEEAAAAMRMTLMRAEAMAAEARMEADAAKAQLENALGQTREERDAMRDQLAELELEMSAAESRAESLQQIAAAHESALTEARLSEAEWKTQSQQHARELEKRRLELSDAEARVAELEDVCSRLEVAVTELTAKYEALRSQNAGTERELRRPAASAVIASVGRAASVPNGSADQARMSRRLEVIQAIVETMDELTAPALGRFAIPVRRLRQELGRLRKVVAAELGDAKSNRPNAQRAYTSAE